MTIDLFVKVIPKAKKTEVVGFEDKVLRIRVKAVPEKGRANDELVRFLSKMLKVPKSFIQIVSGKTSKGKRLVIEGVTLKDIRTCILDI